MAGLLLIIAVAIIMVVILKCRQRKSPKSTDALQNQITSANFEIQITAHNERQNEAARGRQVLQPIKVSSDDENQYNDNYWINVESKRRKVAARINLKYRKTDNQITERIFDVESFSRGEQGYHIHGYCHRKKRQITLSSLGIIDPINIETGEEIKDIKAYIEAKYSLTKEFKQDLFFDKYGWAIYCLVYLAATSGSIVKKEREIITSFIKSLDGFSEIEEEWVDTTIKDIYRPGKMEIRNWIKSALQRGENLDIINDAIEKLSSMQKAENSEFKSFVKYLAERKTA